MATTARKLAVRSERTGASFDYERIGIVDGLTVDGLPVYVEVAESGRMTLVTVSKSNHAHAVNDAPQTMADRPFAPLVIVVNGERVPMAERAAALHCKSNRCARFFAAVPVTSVTMPDGSTVSVTGALALVVKNRDDSANATGSKRGSIVGRKLFASVAAADAWKHAAAGR